MHLPNSLPQAPYYSTSRTTIRQRVRTPIQRARWICVGCIGGFVLSSAVLIAVIALLYSGSSSLIMLLVMAMIPFTIAIVSGWFVGIVLSAVHWYRVARSPLPESTLPPMPLEYPPYVVQPQAVTDPMHAASQRGNATSPPYSHESEDV